MKGGVYNNKGELMRYTGPECEDEYGEMRTEEFFRWFSRYFLNPMNQDPYFAEVVNNNPMAQMVWRHVRSMVREQYNLPLSQVEPAYLHLRAKRLQRALGNPAKFENLTTAEQAEALEEQF